ncbi:MAG: response regulator, partial [Proteobacteria bacterium]
ARFDVLVSDVGMPTMDGYSLAKEIRASQDEEIRNVCAVALTALGRPQDRIQALNSGFDSYITKPVMQEELIVVLKSACSSRKR